MPRARITRSCAAIVYLQHGKRDCCPNSRLSGEGGGANNKPVEVVRVTIGEEGGDDFCYFLVGEDVPESIGSHDQDVVGSVLVVRQVIDFNLKQ